MQSDSDNNNNLKELRKDKGLSITDVANTLKLTTEVIQKLENSEFMSLGAYTYVRGYLSHYANLLGVDAQRYIELIPRSDIEVPLVNTSSTSTKGIKLRRQSTSLFNYAIGTFIVVGISFSGWYLLKNYIKPAKNIEIIQSNSLEILPQNNQSEELTLNEDKYHLSGLIPTKEEPSNNVSGENELLIPPQSTILDAETTQVNNASNTYAYKIIIEASETSWVKVEHLDGSKLHNDLLQPGLITLDANQPVHFRIGNEKNVKVSINGEEIDLTNYSHQDIADFNWPIES